MCCTQTTSQLTLDKDMIEPGEEDTLHPAAIHLQATMTSMSYMTNYIIINLIY
jgi:hypothetical protein